MSIKIPSSYVTAKNRLHDAEGMAMLMKWTLDAEVHRFACNAVEDIPWDNQTWIAMPVNVGPRRFARNELPKMTVEVADPGKMLQGVLEQYTGAEGAIIDIYQIYMGDLLQVANVPHFFFENVGCRIKPPFVYFTLGMKDNPSQIMDPREKLLKNHCRYRFHNNNDPRCPYTGVGFTECDLTLADCKERNGDLARRFGGSPAIGTNRLYV